MYDDLRLLAEIVEILNKRSTRVSPISNWDRSQHTGPTPASANGTIGGGSAATWVADIVDEAKAVLARRAAFEAHVGERLQIPDQMLALGGGFRQHGGRFRDHPRAACSGPRTWS
jgi:hypothetical protein